MDPCRSRVRCMLAVPPAPSQVRLRGTLPSFWLASFQAFFHAFTHICTLIRKYTDWLFPFMGSLYTNYIFNLLIYIGGIVDRYVSFSFSRTARESRYTTFVLKSGPSFLPCDTIIQLGPSPPTLPPLA